MQVTACGVGPALTFFQRKTGKISGKCQSMELYRRTSEKQSMDNLCQLSLQAKKSCIYLVVHYYHWLCFYFPSFSALFTH